MIASLEATTCTGYISLTTLDNNYPEMGRLAARKLVGRIATPDAARTVTLLDPEIRPGRTSSRLS